MTKRKFAPVVTAVLIALLLTASVIAQDAPDQQVLVWLESSAVVA